MSTLKQARAAKVKALEIFGNLVTGNVAVGVTNLGNNQYGLKIRLTEKPEKELPKNVDGVDIVSCEIIGHIRKYSRGE